MPTDPQTTVQDTVERANLIERMAAALWECADDEVGWLASVQLAAGGDTYMQGQVDWCREQATAALDALCAARPDVAVLVQEPANAR